MLHASEQRFAPIDVGQNVLMPIPCVDRPKIGPRNLMGVVTAVTDGFYSIGTQNGHLRQKFTRNQLAPCGAEFFSNNSIPDGETSLRTAVGAASISGSQGHAHCLCLSGCTTNGCACRKKSLLCNSRCHHARSCTKKMTLSVTCI
ncbi:unnamed protein product, partial [Mesorhabditis belari]|uniref:Uncharacterized protein n=1 Tax=Mesorhabditis belari TaxID=2138241 RepID=A0AAF3F6D5_9BILA